MRSKNTRRSNNSQGGSFKARLCTSKNEYIDGVSDDTGGGGEDGYFGNEQNYLLCGIICTKSMVIIFNFIFILSGIFLILFALWTLMYKQDYVALSTSSLYQIATYVLICGGVLIVIAGIIGIVSAWLESKRFLIVFIVLLVSVFVVEMAAGILAFAYKVKLNENLKYDLDNIILEQYNQTGFETKSALLDELQTKLKCCGSIDFSDWRNSKYVKSNNESSGFTESKKYNLVAESCCKSPSHLCGRRTHPSNIYYHGCVMALEKHVSNHIILIGVVSVSACLFQSIGFFLTALLIKRINQRKQYSFLNTNDN